MTVTTYPPGQVPLDGHHREGTIVINYVFPGGIQGPRHPNPGQPYRGTLREAYLPVSRAWPGHEASVMESRALGVAGGG